MERTTRTRADIDTENGVVGIEAGFYWYDYDPVAVVLVIGDGMEDAITWTFALDLLRDGLKDSVGVGDVIVWPMESSLFMHLRSPDGAVTLRFDAATLSNYVSRIPEDVVSSVDDEEIFALLDGFYEG